MKFKSLLSIAILAFSSVSFADSTKLPVWAAKSQIAELVCPATPTDCADKIKAIPDDVYCYQLDEVLAELNIVTKDFNGNVIPASDLIDCQK